MLRARKKFPATPKVALSNVWFPERKLVSFHTMVGWPIPCSVMNGLVFSMNTFSLQNSKKHYTLSTMWKQPRNTLSTLEHRHLQLNKSMYMEPKLAKLIYNSI